MRTNEVISGFNFNSIEGGIRFIVHKMSGNCFISILDLPPFTQALWNALSKSGALSLRSDLPNAYSMITSGGRTMEMSDMWEATLESYGLTCRVCRKGPVQSHNRSAVLKRLKPVQEGIYSFLNHRLQPFHLGFGKEGIQSGAPGPMQIVLGRRKGGFVRSKYFGRPVPLVSPPVCARVQFIVEFGRVDMKLLRIDAHNWAVLFVQATDLEGILAA
jgi:hypothetical protein